MSKLILDLRLEELANPPNGRNVPLRVPGGYLEFQPTAASLVIIAQAPTLLFNANPIPAPPVFASVALTATTPVAFGLVVYNNLVSRFIKRTADTAWQVSAPAHKQDSVAPWGLTAKLRQSKTASWDQAAHQSTKFGAAFSILAHNKIFDRVVWEDAIPWKRFAVSTYQYGLPNKKFVRTPWEAGAPLARNWKEKFVQLNPLKNTRTYPWGEAKHLGKDHLSPFNRAINCKTTKSLPWGAGSFAGSLWRFKEYGVRPADPVPVIPPVLFPFSTSLDLRCPWTLVDHLNVILNFGVDPCPGDVEEPPNPITIQKVYFIVNTLSLKRVVDNVPITVTSVSTGIDRDSWSWSFNGSIPYSELEKVEPTVLGPVEVELEINGSLWRFLIESYDESKTFGKTQYTIRGRSLTAYLDAPYAPIRSYTPPAQLTSRQFVEQELTRPGLETGYSLDWNIINPLGWDMPVGTWGYANLTPMQVMIQIAQGVGGYINSDTTSRVIKLMSEYQIPFWEWDAATPDMIIPRSIIKSHNLQWNEKPAYDGVYVSGERTGVTALVKRTGTPGTFLAPMYVSPFISDLAAARHKGISILSAAGKQAQVSLNMPFDTSIGLLTPGMLIEVNNGGQGSDPAWRGILRSTSVAAQWSNGLKVSQSVDIERHYV